jgi:flagellar assembly factor FliW
MATIETQQFGTVEYTEDAIFEFPTGLPGFESQRRFLCMERPALRPLVFLQSLENPALCFITLPARSVDPDYELSVSLEDLQVLGPTESPTIGDSLACLAIVCLGQDQPATANLLGPVVLNKETRRGVQSIRDDTRYSAHHSIPSAPAQRSASGVGC